MTLAKETMLAEPLVDAELISKARATADLRAQNLSAVCRAIVTNAASAPSNGDLPHRRDDGVRRRRMRFVVNRVVFKSASAQLQEQGGNMSAYIENALRTYVDTGRVR